ncbi:MAG TPA: response regulator [Bacteriovoracaceae bacterium]|nr:response regulator [Bacteriovoracaceae bacterium]
MAKTIFIVEDDQAIRESLMELLETEGYEVFTAENGQDGLEQLSSCTRLPALILLDLMMPIKDGYQFYKEKALNNKIADIPVVIMSADGDIQRKIEKLGISRFLKKPVDIDEVLLMVAEICN